MSETASGDSYVPIMSPDGRFVLFSSTACDLAAETNGNPIPPAVPGKLNAYLRDRQTGVTTLASVSVTGGGGDEDSFPVAVSDDGRYVLFESAAANLVTDDTNRAVDVFLRDLVGAATFIVSAGTNGNPGNGFSRDATMTPDGGFVAFVSAATDLVAGDSNRIPDVFVRDMRNGATVLASYGARSTNFNAAAGLSGMPSISADGRYVAFLSTATNLVPGVRLASDIYVRDLQSAVTHWVSTNARSLLKTAIGVSNAYCFDPIISADGKTVVFAATPDPTYYPTGIVVRYSLESGAGQVLTTNAALQFAMQEEMRSLSLASDGNTLAFTARTTPNYIYSANVGIWVWNSASNSTVLASGNTNGIIPASSFCHWPALSTDGRYVVFLSSAPGLVTNALSAGYHLYYRDLQTEQTTVVDMDTNGFGLGTSAGSPPRISADGRFIAFESSAASLVPDDGNQRTDVFVRDMLYGTNELVSVRSAGRTAEMGNGISAIKPGCLSRDGRFVVFRSTASDLSAADTNNCNDIFLLDRADGTTTLISRGTNSMAGSGPSLGPVITPSGRFIAFSSGADDLVPGDTNQSADVFLYDVDHPGLRVMSCTTNGVLGRYGSFSPILSPDGRFVVFRSKSANLASVPNMEYDNYFLRDVQTGGIIALTQYGGVDARFSGDGRILVVYGFLSSPSSAVLLVRDLGSAQTVFSQPAVQPGQLCVSYDGSRIGLLAAGQLSVLDWLRNTNRIIGAATNSGRLEMSFSADSRSLIFVTASALVPEDTNGVNDVYIYDLESGVPQLISRDFAGNAAGNGASDMPDISSDGRLVAYRSVATDIVPGDDNGLADVFLFDRLSGVTTIVTLGAKTAAAALSCAWPRFSEDRQTLVFQSWAGDLATGDFNNRGDLFAIPIFFISALRESQTTLIQWPAMPGRSFKVQVRDELAAGGWLDLEGAITAAGHKMAFRDASPLAPARFYRVVMQ